MITPVTIHCQGCAAPFTPGEGRGWNRVSFCRECRSHPEHKKRRDKAKNLRRVYGISLHDFLKIYNEQTGRCAVCDEPLTLLYDRPTKGAPRNTREAVVDHNHATGVVRGILCHHCNVAAGHLKDRADVALKMAAYLDRPTIH